MMEKTQFNLLILYFLQLKNILIFSMNIIAKTKMNCTCS